MKEFIGNPFEQELDDDDDLNEFEFEDVLRVVEGDRIIIPPENNDLYTFDVVQQYVSVAPDEDESNLDTDYEPDLDPDYDPMDDNDLYESDDSQDRELHVSDYEIRMSSSDEDEDNLDYFTFPDATEDSVAEKNTANPVETHSSTSNSTSNPQDFVEEDEVWD